MHLAYIDESGDHLSYGLGCVLIPAAQWLEIHDQLVEFRRELSEKQGFRMRHELKATELVSGGGQWHRLGTPIRTRHGVYRSALAQLSALAPVVAAFAVVAPGYIQSASTVHKPTAITKPPGQHAYGLALGLVRQHPQLIILIGRYRLTIPSYY